MIWVDIFGSGVGVGMAGCLCYCLKIGVDVAYAALVSLVYNRHGVGFPAADTRGGLDIKYKS